MLGNKALFQDHMQTTLFLRISCEEYILFNYFFFYPSYWTHLIIMTGSEYHISTMALFGNYCFCMMLNPVQHKNNTQVITLNKTSLNCVCLPKHISKSFPQSGHLKYKNERMLNQLWNRIPLKTTSFDFTETDF